MTAWQQRHFAASMRKSDAAREGRDRPDRVVLDRPSRYDRKGIQSGLRLKPTIVMFVLGVAGFRLDGRKAATFIGENGKPCNLGVRRVGRSGSELERGKSKSCAHNWVDGLHDSVDGEEELNRCNEKENQSHKSSVEEDIER
eukprot:3016908-Rhodomonas_salina.2